MPIPKPKKDEKQKDFIGRCMGNDTMVKEYKDQKQRSAICYDSWRKKHGGKKPTASEQALSVRGCIANVESRTETFEGRKHLVVPIVMLVEGVHGNNAGDVFYPADEIAKFPGAWNGIPVPVYHPKDATGSPMSANDPQVIEKQSVGRVWNSYWDEAEEKLKAEVWIDIEKARKIAPQVLTAVDQQLEISTAHWSDNEFTIGEWNGETYDSIARGIRPDHVALLPGQTGACSWSDGCGIRANMKGGEALNKYLSPFFNEVSHGDIRKQLAALLAPMESDQIYYFIRDVFDDRFIYVKESRDETKMYQQNYSLEDEKVSLSGDPLEVQEKTEYVVQADDLKTNLNDGGKKMGKQKRGCCPDRVTALINNEDTIFSEENSDWLFDLNEDQITILEGTVVEPKSEGNVDHFAQIDWSTLSEDQVKLVAEKLNLKTNEAGGNEPQNVEEYVSNAPTEMQDVLRDGLRMHKAKKDTIVSELLANKRNKFIEEQLRKKDIAELEALSELAQSAPADFSLNSPSQKPTADDEILEIPALDFEKK